MKELKKLRGLLAIAILFTLVTACSDVSSQRIIPLEGSIVDPPVDPPVDSSDDVLGAKAINQISDLPVCTADNEGQLYYVIDIELLMYCNNAQYHTASITGEQGTAGQDGISLNWLGSFDSASIPGSPDVNDGYHNTDDNMAYIWDGDSWEIIVQAGTAGTDGADGTDGISLNWLGSSGTVPGSPSLNDAYYNTADGIAYIWDGDSWEVIAQDGPTGPAGATGATGAPGISITWLGDATSDPLTPSINDAYYNSNDGVAYIWDGSSWETIAQDGATGATGAPGAPGISITWLGSSPSAPGSPSINDAYYNTTDNTSYICVDDLTPTWEILVQDVDVTDDTAPDVSGCTLTVTNVDSYTAKISWDDATDDSGVVKYSVVFSSNNDITTLIDIDANGSGGYVVSLTNTNITGLIPYDTYYFNVVAMDESGNRAAYTTSVSKQMTVLDVHATYYYVTDLSTGLIWKQCLEGQNDDATCSGDASSDIQYCDGDNDNCDTADVLDGAGTSSLWNACNNLNSGSYAGLSNWRVPTIEEALNFYYRYEELPLFDDVFFPNTTNVTYYSSSALTDTTTDAWVVDYMYGLEVSTPKTNYHYVRCVSGP